MSSSWEHIEESAINVISQGTRIEGQIIFDQVSRVHGVLIGDVRARDGSVLILSETAVVEGRIDADRLIIDGYVQGDINTRGKVTISRTGRVVGNIRSPSVELEFGAYFEGRCNMEGTPLAVAGPVLVTEIAPAPNV
jgi:cytoskeletal protein CcmA (bactofilin family)